MSLNTRSENDVRYDAVNRITGLMLITTILAEQTKHVRSVKPGGGYQTFIDWQFRYEKRSNVVNLIIADFRWRVNLLAMQTTTESSPLLNELPHFPKTNTPKIKQKAEKGEHSNLVKLRMTAFSRSRQPERLDSAEGNPVPSNPILAMV
ncbi:hypothetical protein CIRG_10096 [Coccidioides immitis RMSCC 2394]|uniref:Uncharacterized protein n=1 Tax=Coccidioides immitis RMSCC 2394 TaxID=404692 RepID=A0A0J6Y6H7_COCIT|nr:hypothetical protein CIRG_10096 [Coccidioides immitis RMSCC 2394]